MHARGGAHHITSWGKFWLALLGVYAWEGLNPMPPEMWLLPYSNWSGIGWVHPGRFWCHCRMVYLPMSYVYGRRGTCKPSPLTEALRQELYPQPYGSIDWNKARWGWVGGGACVGGWDCEASSIVFRSGEKVVRPPQQPGVAIVRHQWLKCLFLTVPCPLQQPVR